MLLLCVIVNYVAISSQYQSIQEQKFVALKPNHERLGNQKKSIKQAEVEFAFDEHGHRTCCRYDDPSRLIGHPAKYLLLQMSFAQNARYFEEYLPEVRALFNFSSESREQGNRNLRRLNVGDATDFMCVHIRRTDFLDFGIGSDLNGTLKATRDIAARKGLSKFLIFGDDKDFMKSLATQLKIVAPI
ncbi:hypothetical protein ANCCEY_01590 [Ancylostoma ceylanicum]|uniref:L-Fucosyltransferase n=1 Tax=Ancylostoma ceylanicum TaxID=53326 RepID=A0A0D6MCQ0_9BILA|nr:hypothetical protein ANCCEY_01590 [Ancylostoma ceylanicum]